MPPDCYTDTGNPVCLTRQTTVTPAATRAF